MLTFDSVNSLTVDINNLTANNQQQQNLHLIKMQDDDDLTVIIDSSMFFSKGNSSYIFIVLYSISIIVGLIMNLIVIITVIKFRHMRTITNAFVVNLTIFDLLVILFCMPSRLMNEINNQWYWYDEVACKLNSYLQDSAVSGSILTLAFISCTRIYAVNYPFKVRIFLTKFKLMAFIVGIWFLAFFLSTPSLLFKRVDKTEININNLLQEAQNTNNINNNLSDKQLLPLQPQLQQQSQPQLPYDITSIRDPKIINSYNQQQQQQPIINKTLSATSVPTTFVFKACVEDWKTYNRSYKKAYVVFFFIFFYLLPLLTIFGNYLKIAHQILNYSLTNKKQNFSNSKDYSNSSAQLTNNTNNHNHNNNIYHKRSSVPHQQQHQIVQSIVDPKKNRRSESLTIFSSIYRSIRPRRFDRNDSLLSKNNNQTGNVNLYSPKYTKVAGAAAGSCLTRASQNNCYSNENKYLRNWRKRYQQRCKICKMFVLISALFGISWAPMHIMNLLIEFKYNQENSKNVYLLYYYSLWFGHLNSILNPLCYALFCNKFKRCFFKKSR